MDEKLLLRISLLVAVSGLVVLFFLTEVVDVDVVDIDVLSDEYIGKRVTIMGEVVEVEEKESVTIFYVGGDEAIRSQLVVVFDPVFLVVGDSVVVSGEVKDYHGELEIVAERIEVIS